MSENKLVWSNVKDTIERIGKSKEWIAGRVGIELYELNILLSGEVENEEMLGKIAKLLRFNKEFFFPNNYIKPKKVEDIISDYENRVPDKFEQYKADKERANTFYEEEGLEGVLKLFIEDRHLLELVMKDISTGNHKEHSKVQVKKWGNSNGVRISKGVLEALNISESDELSLSIDSNREEIILKKIQ